MTVLVDITRISSKILKTVVKESYSCFLGFLWALRLRLTETGNVRVTALDADLKELFLSNELKHVKFHPSSFCVY